MSGITSIINFDRRAVPLKLLSKMTEQVAYRGPHGVSYLIKDGVGFGHLALHSTPESVFEKQPYIHAESGVVLVSDARVDNRHDLIRSLSLPRGTEKPVTDAEIIVAAYLRWGSKAAKNIVGDFAFLIWDPRIREVYAARDPMGIRNLHFAFTGQTLLVTSEAQQILQYPTISSELNEFAVIEWAIGRVTSRYCMFKDIHVLQAGRCLRANADGYEVDKFWSINPANRIHYRRSTDYAEHLIEVLDRAVQVRLRTRSKVVGAELSGGVDSTTIAALAKRTLDKRGSTLKTISYQFPSSPTCDESVYIESITKHLSLQTHYLNAESQGVLEYPKGFKHTLESPWVREYPFMNYECRFFREQGAEVFLTGNGGDEVAPDGDSVLRYRLSRGDLRVLFEVANDCRKNGRPFAKTSYHTFLEPNFPDGLNRALRRISGKKVCEKNPWPKWVSPRTATRLKLAERYYSPINRKRFSNLASQFMYENLVEGLTPSAYGANELMAAHHGLEVRHPFLDQNVVEFCFAVPVNLWHRHSHSKWLLKHATKGLLPDDIRWRQDKTVATEVFGKAMKKNMSYIEKVLGYNCASVASLYDAGILEDEFKAHFQEANCLQNGAIDFALSLQCWLHTNRKVLNY